MQDLFQRTRRFDLVFALLGSLLALFVLLPLGSVLFSTAPAQLADALGDPELARSILVTFSAAAIAVFLALFSGIPLAYLLARRRFPGKRWVEALVGLPVVVPHTAAGVALLLVFGRRGLIGGALAELGVTFTDNLAGIVIAMLFVSLPFLVNSSRTAFALVEQELEWVAQVDGATPWQAFWLVTLPIAWRGVVGGALMMWARGISEFGAVVILAYHPKIVPVLVYERFGGFGLGAALPAAAWLVLTTLVIFLVLQFILLPNADDQ